MAELRQWEVDALGTRQEKRITVLDAEQYDPGFPPGRLVEFQQWFDDLLAQIPEDYRQSAEVEFGSCGGYYDGDHYGKVGVTYRRYETDEEWEARKRDVTGRLEQYKAEREHAERVAYEHLKAKFDGPASADRSPQGGDRETGRHAKHESAVPSEASADAPPPAPSLQTPQGGDS